MEQQHEKESSNVRVSPAGESSHRRFSSIEGWKEVANNMYYAAGHGLVNLSTSPDIDGVPNENADVITRQASHTEHDTSMNTSTIQQTDDEDSDPFSSSNNIAGEDQFKSLKDETQTTKAEEPYHVFTPRQRWFVVVIIGAAGLFSGLSSNIYFPALDAIAKVSLDLFLQRLLHTVLTVTHNRI